MRFIPAPRHLSAHVLGVTVLHTTQAQAVTTPAHALGIFTLVYRGALQAGAQVASAGALLGQGSATTARGVVASPGTVAASLLCRASILPLLSGEPASQFTDAAVPAHLVGLDAGALLDRLGPGPSDDALASALFAQVAQALRAARVARASATRFARDLAGWAQGGLCGRPEGWSERQWQRACQAELGTTPVLLQRLHRLHASVRGRLVHGSEPLAQHAVEAGFFDQSHMAREYRLLAGTAPRHGLASGNHTAAAMGLGASELAPRFFAR